MLFFLKFLKPLKWQFLFSLLMIFSHVALAIQTPKITAHIVSEGIIKNQPSVIISGVISYAIISLLCWTMNFFNNYHSPRVSVKFALAIQRAVVEKVLSLGKSDINQFGVSTLLSRSTSDIRTMERFLDSTFFSSAWAVFTAVGIVIEAVRLAPSLSWIIIIAAVASLSFIPILTKLAVPEIRFYRKLIDKLSGSVRSNVSGIKVIRAFSREPSERRRFTDLNRSIARSSRRIDYIFALEGPFVALVYDSISLLCVWVGLSMLQSDLSHLGILSAFLNYLMRIVGAFTAIASNISSLPRAKISAGRIREILDIKPAVTWQATTTGNPTPLSDITFQNVTFKFPDADEELLQNISFTAKAGETTAFIGSTGCGKTTLAELILRLHDTTSGNVLVGGVNVKNYAKSDLMQKIGYVPQKGILFSGTVAENLRFGAPHASGKELIRAAKIAMIHSHIQSLPKQYQSQVSQTGKNFSGGQKQRLSIARALVKQPEILIFDDAFSALDLKTDRELRQKLRPHLKNVTNIIVAQRINTIKDAEQIIVLDKGQIVGRGRHLDLLRTCPTYYDIASSQFSPAELTAELHLAEQQSPPTQQSNRPHSTTPLQPRPEPQSSSKSRKSSKSQPSPGASHA